MIISRARIAQVTILRWHSSAIVAIVGIVVFVGELSVLRGSDTADRVTARRGSSPLAGQRRDPVVAVYEKVKGGIVNIHSERTVVPAADDPFRLPLQPQRVNGMGTGIVLDPRGYILTNFHVVDDVQTLRVRLCDGSGYPARIVATDKEGDLAVIKIDPQYPLPLLVWGTSADLMVGEAVIAIGNAYGYEHSITDGRVSYKGRDVTLNKEMGYRGLIQTSAPINPGNSGGPLLNLLGEVVGVNVAIRAGAQNIGFALPVDSVIPRAAELLARRRGGLRHGLVVRDVAQRDELEGPVRRSVVVEAVEVGSPAAQAGFKAGDVVLQSGEITLFTSIDLERSLLERGAGASIPFKVRRGVEIQNLTLELAPPKAASTAAELIWRKLGMRLVPVGAEGVSRVNSQLRGGMLITEVAANSVAAVAGLQRGDILVGLHTWETLNHDNVAFVLQHKDFASFLPLKYYVIRDGRLREGWLPISP
ncbi:MAG: trypsin-like peptidase domain-containing protein [Gemmataceae bacterium]|nr:trypsin-like peptidase domain-containing protein [Gemmataceae bacterium]MDW8242874.1 trypsin-like peptidase domain-containing protein [Thermogemmata sp.]